MAPQEKFEALQTNTGCSMLFSVASDGVFYLTLETPGTITGWTKSDLSTPLLGKYFNSSTKVRVKSFDVAQNSTDGTIGLAIVLTDSVNDHLYLCLGNSNSDTSWTTQASWLSFPYDNKTNPQSILNIQNVFISEALEEQENVQYIFVDIIKDPSSPEKLISRYYIDTTAAGGYCWMAHNLSIDLEPERYSSCIGRQGGINGKAPLPIDGIYTFGTVNNNAQFIYQPLYNIWNPSAPASSARLNLPGNIAPSALACCRNQDQSTDLFVVAGQGLYYFASTNQTDGAQGILLMENTLFEGTTKMDAYKSDTLLFVWGLNEANEVFYSCCPLDQITAAGAWKVPIAILSGVDLISPYLNLVNNGNTFFAVGGNDLFKMTQSPQTTLWTSQSVTLPAPTPNAPAQAIYSYTTRILLSDQNNQPVVNAALFLSANTRSSFYINNLYYILDTTPIAVATNNLGCITIIESVDNIYATQLLVSQANESPVVINPMNQTISNLSKLNSVSSLQSAVIINNDGSSTPLVASGNTPQDLQAAVSGIQGLNKAYNSFTTTGAQVSRSIDKNNLLEPLKGFDNAIITDVGDIFSYLESDVDSVITIIEDDATALWYFMVNIEGEVYQGVLDCAEKVVAAVKWVFHTLKTSIEDLIAFLKFLFDWQDILLTHKVLKNVFTLQVQSALNAMSGLETDIQSAFTALKNDIGNWTDIPELDQTYNGTTGANPPLPGQNTVPAHYLIHHYQANVANAASSYAALSPTEAILEDLIALLNAEETTFANACQAIKTDIIDPFGSLSITEIIKRLVVIISDTLLDAIEGVLIAVVKVFIQVVKSIMDALTATIDFPILSDLYKDIAQEELSFLDLICLISAVPTTIIYKIAAGVTPFPKGDSFTVALLNARSLSDFQNAFFTPDTTNTLQAPKGNQSLQSQASPELNQGRLKTFGFVAGFVAMAGSIIMIGAMAKQAAVPDIEGIPPSKTWVTIIAVSNIAYVFPNISGIINFKSDNWYQQMNNGLTCISLVKGFVDIWFVTSTVWKSRVSPFIETAINFIWNFPVGANIYYNKNDVTTTYKSLVPESIGNFAFNGGGILAFPIAMANNNKELQAVLMGTQYVLMASYGVCIVIAGGIYEWVPGQDH